MRRWPTALIAVIATAIAALLSGCSTVAQESPAEGEPSGRIVATANFGGDLLLERRVPPGQSVLRALRGATPVETSYGGGFVSEMLDRSSDPSRRRDWFYWVDGALADVGARHRDLGEGEEAWWDYRDWGQLTDIWAVVGQWPAPFVSAGSPDRGVFADEPLRAELVAEGVTISSDPRAPFRVRVGSNEALVASDPAWERASVDPDGAGLTVAIDDGQIVALGPNGEKRSPVPGARALAAAVPSGLESRRGILMVVAGLDQEAAEAAAETIADRPEALRLRFAVAFDREGDPITGSGAST